MTEEINLVIQKLSANPSSIITGFRKETLEIIEPLTIIRIFSTNQKVYLSTMNGVFQSRLRLYELEDRLDKHHFVRISNSEIINLKQVKNFDLSFTGTICVTFLDRNISYVSRRYVNKLKHTLGIGGKI